jgi:NADH-quinone oxidoreductase subunit G
MLELEIDGKLIEVAEGTTVMEAANRLGIFVPHFCYHRKLSIAANCRMCLVQVEKAPKPLPACATPVTAGMKVWTHSDAAVNAQKGVMEFLLINHPLDCPICDQGGECSLQDLAVGYGGSASRYQEDKRVVVNKNLGPLIATDMTRCIHCTRCVRFGQEIAGVMELGMINRSEHAEIITFVGKTVDSELSGNVIDLCPVGALTSKPFRYSARTWELVRRKSVSPHCGLGANLTVQVKQNRVMRVLPRDNDAINECWLSDKDRFAYEGLNSDQRLVRPLLKRDGQWREVDWQIALEYVATELKRIRAAHGAAAIGTLATAHQTLEELFLLGKLARGFADGNVDFRLRQADFAADSRLHGAPWLGMDIAELNQLDRVLIVGSNVRKDHPLIAHRLRQAAKKQLQVNVINATDDDWLMRIVNRAIVRPSALAHVLAQVVKATAGAGNLAAPAQIEGVEAGEAAQRIAASLASGSRTAVLLGNSAQHHPQAAQLHALGLALAATLKARFGFLGEAANSVGGYLAGAVPAAASPAQRAAGGPAGLNAQEQLRQPRKAYLLLGVEAELDTYDAQQALAAMRQAELVVALSPYQHGALDYAQVMLPIAPFTETSGTFVNTAGRAQTFTAVVSPLAETRPAWKVLRVLGNLLDLPGFDYNSTEEIRAEILAHPVEPRLSNQLDEAAIDPIAAAGDGLERIGEVPIHAADAIVRRAESLQQTRDGMGPGAAAMNGNTLAQLGLKSGDSARLGQPGASAELKVVRDDKLPDGCVRVAAGHALTAGLGAMFGAISVQRAGSQERMAG